MGNVVYGSVPWWQEKVPHQKLFSLVREQYSVQASRYQTFRRYANIYEYGWRGADRTSKYDRSFDDQILHFNRAQNAVDTVISEVTSAKLQPMATTEGANWEQRENSDRATRALGGLFQELEFDGLFEQAAIDACTAGCGFIKIFADVDRCNVKAQRVAPVDMLVDENEAAYGEPRCLYQRCLIDKWYCAETWGVPNAAMEESATARREKILGAGIPDLYPGDTWDSNTLVEVVEAWHLPSFLTDDEEEETPAPPDEPTGNPYHDAARRKRKRKTDGRHVICIGGFTLFDDTWERDYFPFMTYRPKKSRRGFWGIPLMRQLAPGQRELENLDAKLQRAHRRMGGAHFIAPKSAKLDRRKITNDSGDILEYEGNQPPTEWTPAAAHPQTYSYRESLQSDMLRFIGTSQFSARSEVPQGMQNPSGKALMMVADQGSKYLGPWLRERERGVVNAADLMIDAIEEVVEHDPQYAAKFITGKGYEKIDWGPIVEQRKSYVIRVEPINALSTSPGARVAQATEWLQAGAFDPDNPGARQWRRLSGIPDLEAENELDMADEEIIKKNLDWMVRTGKPMSPEPWNNLAKILEIGGKFLDMCQRQEVPMAKLKRATDYITDAHAMIEEARAKQAPPPGTMGPMGPGGPGGPPPDGGMPMDPSMTGGGMPPPGPDQGGAMTMGGMPPQVGPPMVPAAA